MIQKLQNINKKYFIVCIFHHFCYALVYKYLLDWKNISYYHLIGTDALLPNSNSFICWLKVEIKKELGDPKLWLGDSYSYENIELCHKTRTELTK